VILFGSHAHETAHSDSDIDLLIIKETPESFFDRVATVRQAVSGFHKGIPFDPLLLTPSEVQARVKAGDQFIAEILERGEVLYAA
jgi:predicted nucleotidyltransferase